MIKTEDGKTKYYDKNSVEITAGCRIRFPSGDIEKVYLTDDDQLGTDATNKKWIESGRAVECEYGVYPLTSEDTQTVEVVAEAEE